MIMDCNLAIDFLFHMLWLKILIIKLQTLEAKQLNFIGNLFYVRRLSKSIMYFTNK